MTLTFQNTVYPVDDQCGKAFITILNLILLSDNIVHFNRDLIAANRMAPYLLLSGYFKWSFTGCKFTLRQRVCYGSEVCFDDDILEFPYEYLLKKGKRGITN